MVVPPATHGGPEGKCWPFPLTGSGPLLREPPLDLNALRLWDVQRLRLSPWVATDVAAGFWRRASPDDNVRRMTTFLLPGADLVGKGIADLSRGVVTIEALLVSIGAPRFRALHWDLPAPLPNPEERLYAMLSALHGDGAHSRYNALVRRLVSLQQAAACAR